MATDGDIDFKSYTREQLDSAVTRIDRQRNPINAQNLITEYQRRRVAERQAAELAARSETVAPPDKMLSAPRTLAVRFEPSDSFSTWLAPSRNDFHLIGSGTIQVDGTLVRLTGRQFSIMFGLPFIHTHELGFQFVFNVEVDGDAVRFELRVPGEKARGLTMWLRSAADAEELSKSLPAGRTSDVVPQLAGHVEFERSLIAQSPKTPVTYGLVIACVCVYVTTALGTNHLFGFDGQSVVSLGSNFGPYTTDGDWWRLLTSMFLHLGLIHLAFNMWALASFGPIVERLYGSVSYFLIYLVSGLAGSLASVSWQPQINSVGASGAIFGIFGGLLAVQIHNGSSIPTNVLRPLRYTSIIYIACTLIGGLSNTGVDNAAHIGGLAAGFLMGLTLSRQITGRHLSTREFGLRFARGAPLALCLLAVGVWCAKHESTRLTGEGLFAQTFHWYAPREDAIVDLWNQSTQLSKTAHWSDETYANWLDREVLPFWKEADLRFRKIGLPPASPAYSLVQSLQKVVSERLRAYQLIDQGLRQHDDKMRAEGLDVIEKGNELIKEKLE
jgi:rhomboid protease GluP